MRDTVIKVATCNRCKAYVFACEVNGFKTAVDPAPLDVEGYRAALLASRPTYEQLDQAGRPWKLHARSGASQWPPFAGRKLLGEHGCGTRAMNVTGFDLTELPAPKAPATVTEVATPLPSPGVPAVATRAKNVTPVRFDGWRQAKVFYGPLLAAPCCVLCGMHAYLRHPVTNQPMHKVCAEESYGQARTS